MWSVCKRCEAGFDSVHDVPARSAYVVAALSHAAKNLGGDDHVFAGDLQVLQRLAEHLLALAFRINIGRVEEVDAGVD